MTTAGERAGMAALVAALAPGGRLVGRRKLHGGLGARMDALRIGRRDGSRLSVSLRRFAGADAFCKPEHVRLEYETLRLVERAGVPAPRPLLLDDAGQFFGVPAIALSYVPGRPVVMPRDERAWVAGLAEAMLVVHAVGPLEHELSFLPRRGRREMGAKLGEWRREAAKAGGLAVEVASALVRGIEAIAWEEPCLVHDDFHPGNVIWQRGRWAAVVDWTQAVLGDRREDISQCRADLVVSRSIEAADAFLEAYEALSGATVADLWYFDLHRGLMALLYHEQYMQGYRDLGLALDAVEVTERIRRFLRRALKECRGS